MQEQILRVSSRCDGVVGTLVRGAAWTVHDETVEDGGQRDPRIRRPLYGGE